MIAAVETGGTKVLCAVFDPARPTTAMRLERFPTTTPGETIARIDAWVDDAERSGMPVGALGIGSFGPVNVRPGGSRYGWITGTSKPGWAGTWLLGRLVAAHRHPVALLSDVTAAAVGEAAFGAGAGSAVAAYATIGTGVGVGISREGVPQHGDGFPELGHLLVRRHPEDHFDGVCPFHGDCLEGLASGPAISARWGSDGSSLGVERHRELLEVIGWYVGQLVVVVCDATGADRVVMGGGVMKTPGMIPAVRAARDSITGGAQSGHVANGEADDLIVPAALGDLSGLIGAAVVAAGIDADADHGATGATREG